MKSHRILELVAAVVVTLALSVSAWGQATTSLNGTITDPSGATVPNAKVTLTNQATNATRQTTTSSTGAYDFPSVLPGTYNLTVQASGFRTYVRKGVSLQVDFPATVNAQMQVGAVSQEVSVTAAAPLVNTTDASLGKTMGSTAISQLPLKAENTVLLLSLQPGVVYNGENILTDSYDTRAGSVNGEHSDQNNITLDGVSNNFEYSGYAFTGVLPTTPYSVQEFRVSTSNYGAAEGRSAGAQIAMVTKGGTNRFHGNLYEYNRSTLGEANDFFLNQTGQPRPHLVRNIYGGAIGGPIIKDRLFFFFNYEGHRQSLGASVARTIPTPTLADGIIQYKCADSTQCPGMSVAGMSGKSYSIKPGFYALGPASLKQMDPLGIGPSPVVNNYFKQYPVANDTSTGDGYNTSGFRFAAPTTQHYNWYITRLDYHLATNHTLFFRGTAVDDHDMDAPFLPGMPSESPSVTLNKGFVAGYTAILKPTLVNNFRIGLTRESVLTAGTSNQPWNEFREIDQGITRSYGIISPTYNVVDTMNWMKGSHNFKFGTNIILSRRDTVSYGSSFSYSLLNADWVATSGFAVGSHADPLDPAYGCAGNPGAGTGAPCFPAVNVDFTHSYDFPLANMMGMASEVEARFNYHIDSTTQATPLAEGAALTRHWATGNYGLYFEDTWKMRPNFTVSYGLNYQLMTPVTETAGQQVLPNVDMGAWFNQRVINGKQGVPSNQDPVISFIPGGSHWGKPGLYSAQTGNFAPRVGVAWSPHPDGGWLKSVMGEDKTVIRAGFGIYYDNFGPALSLTYSGNEPGLSATLQNPAGVLDIADVPRITGMNIIPTTDNSGNSLIGTPPSSTYPTVYTGHEAIASGIDQSLKTPYSLAADFSIDRTLPGNMVLDMAYVGHFGHRILAYDDIAVPLNFVDPKSGVSYFAAATRLSQLARNNVDPSAITASMVGPTAAFWQNLIVPRPGNTDFSLCGSGSTTDPLVAAYAMMKCELYNETSGLYRMDIGSSTYNNRRYPMFSTGLNSLYNYQYSSLWDWRSIGYSSYNALQVSLRKQMSHGVLFAFNYTLSKSLDIQSQSERGIHYLTDSIINPYDIRQMYAPSDFDLRHQFNGYWVAQLPFGQGRALGAGAGRVANAIIGGWQYSGTIRMTSGFPMSVFMGYVWPTNWDEMGWANTTGSPIVTGNTTANVPNIFHNPSAAAAGFDFAYPGQSGIRNNVRGDGMFNMDMNLAKTFTIRERNQLQFRWSVFNVTNSVRFDPYSFQDQVAVSTSFGNYSSTLTSPRVMEFSLVYSF